jgi:putative nucleotidyltransferase with HDIG domain
MKFRLGLQVPLGHAIETRQTILISSAAEVAARYPIISFPGSTCRSLIAIPLIVDHRCLGAIAFRYEEEHKFTAEDRSFLRNLGEQTAQALDRARLYDAEQRQREKAEAEVIERQRAEARLHRQNARLAALHRIDVAISSGFDLQKNLAVYLQEVATQLNVDAADILLCSADGNFLEFAAGSEPWMSGMLRQRSADALVRSAIYSHQVVQQSLSAGENPWARSGHGADWTRYFAVPLIARNEPCGVLELYTSGLIENDEEWAEFLATLSGQGAIAIDNSRLLTQLVAAYDATIEGWSRALDLRDKETEGHSRRVTEMTVRLAKTLGVDEHMLEHIRRGALLHDIGKMGVPDSILLKPAELTHDEQTEMRRHPSYAFELLSPITFLKPALDIPYYHHEKWDGTGYPRGLRGEEIPLAARIFAVADVWDALNSDRPYRARWPKERVREHIKALSGTHFDPKVVEAFLRLQEKG